MEDKLIIESFLQDRTEESFSSLFVAFCARVRRFFVLHGLDVAAAEDLTQEVFLKVYRKASELREAERFPGWIFAIARNMLISYWRQRKTRIAEAEPELLSYGLSERVITETDVIRKLQLLEWLNELEVRERDLLILRFVEGLSYKELAVALHAPVGTRLPSAGDARNGQNQIIVLERFASLQDGRELPPKSALLISRRKELAFHINQS